MKNIVLVLMMLEIFCVSIIYAQIPDICPILSNNPAIMVKDVNMTSVGLASEQKLTGFDKAPFTSTFVAVMAVNNIIKEKTGQSEKEKNDYAGLKFNMTRFGIHQNIELMISFGHKMKIAKETFFILGAASGIACQTADFTKIAEGYYDNVLAANLLKKRVVQASFGAFLEYKNFYWGNSIENFIDIPGVFLEMGCNKYKIAKNIDMRIFLKFGYQQTLVSQQSILLMLYDSIGFGLDWQDGNKWALLTSFRYGWLQCGYTYQITDYQTNVNAHKILLQLSF